MRKITILYIAFLLLSVTAFAQSKDEQQIRQVLDIQTEAWNKGDLKGFMNGYWESDSLMFIGKSGVNRGWLTTLRNYEKGYPDSAAMGKLNFTLIELKPLSGKYFFVVGKWQLTRSIGNLSGHFTLLFRKIKKRWVIVADHSS
jgi:ketosteroid isomerase-like protein